MKSEYILETTRNDALILAQENALELFNRKLTEDELDIFFKKVGIALAENLDAICKEVVSDLETQDLFLEAFNVKEALNNITIIKSEVQQ